MDTPSDIPDIRPERALRELQNVELDWWVIAGFTILILIVVAAFLAVVLRRQPEEAGEAPIVRARQKLAALEPTQLQDAELADRLLDLLRDYVGAVCDLPTAGMTSREFLESLQSFSDLTLEAGALAPLLAQCDELRFAGGSAGFEGKQSLCQRAGEFLELIENKTNPPEDTAA